MRPKFAAITRFKQAFVMQAAGAQPFAVAGAGAHDEGQTARGLRFDEALLERGV